ncbi:hypothetical protein JTB14_029961 [Gonioctena quinquepunctata]|nr:hypothetical protein JTB14_029961 [Gonioctena quinquepunctata]
MAISLRQYKENESRVHEKLYENICSLMHFYQPSDDCRRVFKKDMFVKNNKTAFYELVYYLLDILNPELTKQKLTAWPPYEIRRESKFRSELLQYINELNSIYENADIPHIMPSHLISPGGYKFGKFMLKLSQLIVHEHLRKTKKKTLFYCPKPHKNTSPTKATISNINITTSKLENSTREYLDEYELYHNELKDQASCLVADLTDLDAKIGETKKQLSLAKTEFSKNYPSYPSTDTLKEDIQLLQKEWKSLKNIHDLFKESGSLLSYLTSNTSVLVHNKEEMKIPSSVLHIIMNKEQLNLTEMFHGLQVLLEQKSLELPNPTPLFIEDIREKVQKVNERLSRLERELLERKNQTQVIVAELQENIKLVEYLIRIPTKTVYSTIDSSDEMFGICPLEY